MSESSLLSRYKDIHESHIKEILTLLFTGAYKDSIAFKGGTLAYFCYGLTRFSTDIDLDLLDASKEKEVMEYIDTLLIGLGHTEKVVGKDLHRWRFRYDPKGRIIKIELNKRQSDYTRYEWVNIDKTPIQAQTSGSMVTNKLLALGLRWYNRDLYDIYFFLRKGCLFEEDIIQDKTGGSLKQRIEMIINDIPLHFKENTILHQLGEVLDIKQKPRVKSSLITETIKLLQQYLSMH